KRPSACLSASPRPRARRPPMRRMSRRQRAHLDASPWRGRAQAGRLSAATQRVGADELSDAKKDPADRRPWRRTLLDGARALAARRLRALAHRSGPPARLLFADRVWRRRPLRRALLPPLLALLRGQPR